MDSVEDALFVYQLATGALLADYSLDSLNQNPRGIWSDGDVIYVADEQDDQVYSYNIPDAIQARLGALSLSALELGGFRAVRLAYPVEAPVGTASTTIVASATQAAATVAIAPADADADAHGHQIALWAETTITIRTGPGPPISSTRPNSSIAPSATASPPACRPARY